LKSTYLKIEDLSKVKIGVIYFCIQVRPPNIFLRKTKVKETTRHLTDQHSTS